MRYRVRYTDPARRDLRDIYTYIAYTLHSKRNARRMVDRLLREIDSLTEMPDRYMVVEQEPWRSRGFRRTIVGSYCILYAVDKERGVVHIARIVYGRRDFASLGSD